MHYFADKAMPCECAPIHTPHLLTALLLLLKPLDYLVRFARRFGAKDSSDTQ
jgi:hypothetical protein